MIDLRASAAAAATVGLLAVSAPVSAQPSPAEAAFTKGLAEMQAGRFETGCPALEESQRLDPRAGTLFTLAECESKRGRIGTALSHYRDYLTLFEAMKPDQQARQGERPKIAKKQNAALEARVPTLTLVLPPDAPQGISIKRDGAEVSPSALGVALPVDPGEHVVTTQAPGGPAAERRIVLAAGDRKQILIDAKGTIEAPRTVALPPPSTTPEGETPPAQGPSGRRVGAYVAGGVGVAGLILGGVMGGLTLQQKSVITANCSGADGTLCNHEGKTAADSSKTTGLVSTVGFALGGVGVGVAAVLFLTEPRKKSPPLPSAAAAAAAAVHLRGDVLAVGREGALLGLRGEW